MRRSRFNPKRRLRETALSSAERERLLEQVEYTGNPAHKRDPGDFGLSPPAGPRDDKTLCDPTGILQRAEAQRLLLNGVRRDIVSSRTGAGDRFPQNVWAVDAQGFAFEAQLENPERGTYHGYPMPLSDPFREVVLEQWRDRDV